jgi:transposase
VGAVEDVVGEGRMAIQAVADFSPAEEAKSAQARRTARPALPQSNQRTEKQRLFSARHAWRQLLPEHPRSATMWRLTPNNGITEGFHTRMEMLQRQAYGLRNFTNYRLRAGNV